MPISSARLRPVGKSLGANNDAEPPPATRTIPTRGVSG